MLEFQHFHAGELARPVEQLLSQGQRPVDLDHAWQHRGLREVTVEIGQVRRHCQL
ncbi:hypothetical protein D3C75_1349080 [compost metagenome]